MSETEYAEIECPSCGGYGCSECQDGFFKLTTCGRNFIDSGLIRAVNMTSYADKGILPTSGGLLEQSAWFMSLWSAVTAEQNAIDNERYKGL